MMKVKGKMPDGKLDLKSLSEGVGVPVVLAVE